MPLVGCSRALKQLVYMLAAKTPTRLRVAGVAGITIGGIYVAGALQSHPFH